VLVGRSAEEAWIRRKVLDPAGGARVLVVHGEPGIGKSALLTRAVAVARRSGFRIVEAAGLLPAAGVGDPRLASLATVRQLCGGGPLLIVADNVSEVGPPVVALLAFVARRLRTERLVILLAGRSLGAFSTFADRFEVLAVPPLSPVAAAALLDGLPSAPTGPARAEILRHGGGNPLALIISAAEGHDAGLLANIFVPEFAELPDQTRRVLLFAAAAQDDTLMSVLRAAGAGLTDCRPAEATGLLTIIEGRFAFRNAPARAVCYFTATPADRDAAHARFTALLPFHSPARDWHEASVSIAAIDAAALERAAGVAAQSGRGLEAAGLLQRAGDASTDPREAARLHGLAAAEADRYGDLRWSRQLWNRVTRLTDDSGVLAGALAGIGNGLMWQPPGPMLALVEKLAGTQEVTRTALAVAARTVFTDGDPAVVERLRALVDRATPTDSDAHLAMAMAVADPAGWHGRYGPLRLSPLLQPLSGAAERDRLLLIAGVAWVLDDIEIAVDHYRRSLAAIRADGSIGVHATASVATCEVLFDMGLFEEAAGLLDDAEDVAGGDLAGPVRQAVLAQQAFSLIRRGDTERARPLLAAAGEPAAAENRLVRYLLLRALAQLDAAEGKADTAYTRLAQVFDRDGVALHYLLSQRSVIELTGLAIDACRGADALNLLTRARALAGHPTRRREWTWNAAEGLLRLHAGEETAEQQLRDLLAVPGAGSRWPYEYAVTEVRLAEELSVRRRRSEARPLLISALDVFVRTGAVREAASTRERLRATGVRAPIVRPTDAFDALTPQHQLITQLAAEGLSNRAIAQRFGLSPRTIGCYLYQIYPKLGIARRSQLREVIRPL
jgi:DNA-binding CsgD family transcriptional regulator